MYLSKKDKFYFVGWSFGGIVQILHQMKNNQAQKIVSLDAASQYEYGWSLLQSNNYFKKSKFNIPFYQFVANAPRKYKIAKSLEFFENVAKTKEEKKFGSLTHARMLSFIHQIENKTNVIEEDAILLYSTILKSLK